MIIRTTTFVKQTLVEYLYHGIILLYKKGLFVQEDKKEKRKRIIFDVPLSFHTEIKTRAAFRGITITEWVIIAINERIAEERKTE